MKHKSKKIISLIMALITVFMTFSVGIINAEAYGSISYTLNPDGKSYCVSDCDDTYFGRAKISATYSGLPVTRIADNAFDNSDIYEVVVPESVTVIGANAFAGCVKLRTVNFANGVTEIKANAFSNCTSLRKITFPESVKTIGDYAFSGCTALVEIYFLGKKTEISIYSDIGIASGATVYGYFNSTAEKYAVNHNVDFASIVCDETVLHTPESTDKGLVLTWDKVKGATSYIVYKKADGEKDWKEIATVSTTKFTDKDVVCGENYIYTVKACNDYLDGEYNKAGVDAVYLKKPVLVSAESSAKGVTVKWEAVDGAEEYNIYHKKGLNGWEKIGTTSSLSFVDKTAQSGKNYKYTVTAVASAYRKSFESAYDNKGIKVKVTDVATPAIDSVIVTDYNEITVEWNENEGAEHYIVYRSTKKDSGFKEVAKVKANVYVDRDIKFNTKYFYKVVTVDGGESNASPVRGRTARVPAPVVDKNIYSTPKKVTLTWGKVSSASGYMVYRYDSAKKDWVKIATIRDNAKVEYADAKTGTNKYKICSFKTVNGKDYVSAFSDVVTTTTFSKPTLDVKQYGNGFVNEVTWTSVSKATGYLVYYKVSESGKWTHAASVSNRINTITMDVTHGQYYYWKVRPIFEKDGITTAGSYSNVDDVMIFYTPSMRVAVSNQKVENAKTVSITIENKGACPIRILKNDAYIYNGPDKVDSYGTISLIDSTGKKLDYQDIAPGQTATVTFLLDGVKKGYYDSKTLIQFYFNYDNMKYILQTDASLSGSQAKYQLA